METTGDIGRTVSLEALPRRRSRAASTLLPELQGIGLGSQLIEQVCGDYGAQILVGTWRAAGWAIRFYERHGFETVPESSVPLLLRNYWKISDRQIETSIVLARPALDEVAVRRLVGGSRARE